MRSLARRALRFLLAAVAFVAGARAASSVCHNGYTVCTWRIEDGLPQSTVTTITQTRDGYLWVGTLNGLARFDGVRFQVFDHFNTDGLRDGRIAALFESSDGTLWIGHDSGAITRYRAGRFSPVARVGTPRDAVLRLGEDSTGTIWVLGISGTLEAIGGPPSLIEVRPGPEPTLLAFAQGEDRTLWFALDGALHELRAGRVARVDLGPAHESDFIYGIGAARGGGVWVVRDGRARVWEDGAWHPQRGSFDWRGDTVTRLVECRSGSSLAIGTMTNGLYLLFRDGRQINFDHRNSGLQNWVRIVYEDREGNLWIGAGSGGLSMVRASGIAVLNPPDDWQGRTTLTVATGPENSLWVGTEGAGLYRRQDERWTRFGEEHGLRNLFIWALAPDATGRMFAGTWNGGLFRQDGERFVPVEPITPVTTPIIGLQLTMDPRTQWIATGAGLVRLVEGEPARLLREPGQAETFVSAVVRDARGVLWAALPERGLARVTDDALLVLGRQAGLASDSAQCLLADGDTLWIGTRDAGLSRFRDGKFASIDRARGLVSNAICHIADDQRGYLWISTHRGIMRLAKTELHRCADGALAEVGGRVFDKSDGLPTLEFSGGLQDSGCRTRDGRLWFTSNKGVVSFDPAAISPNATPPPVVIESLDVDGTDFPAGEAQPLQLAPNHHRLEFHYTALTLTASSKAHFKHRLAGLDRDWIDAGAKRSAVYSQLPRGDYEFQVIAANEDRVWNLTGATLRFSVLPFYWQTWWFRGASALAALSAVAWLARFVTRRRLQRRVRELEYERGIERERARIAQDIHDDIGSSLTRISMLSQTARGELEQPRRAATLLERIHATALEVTAALDEIVWAVNPRHDTLDSLVSYMAKFAQETLATAQVRCRLDLPADLPAWPLNAHTRHNLILAFKEALHNALKHSGASEVRVSLTLHPEQFIIAVEDNGRGFDAAAALAATNASARPGRGGNGLHNFQRRLALIGGRCEIDAATGQGTRVRFTVGYPSLTPDRS